MMKEAFYFYRGIHRQYWWFHVLFSVVLLLTSVFWFVLPFYIVNYGDYEPTLLLKLGCIVFLCIFPSVFVTLHCWLISFIAAKKWREHKDEESFVLTFVSFQSMAFFIVLVFTAAIYVLFLFIDVIRGIFA